MASIRSGKCQIEVETARRVTVIYGYADTPRFLTVVGNNGEAWSIADDGGELGTRPKGVVVHGKRPPKGVKTA